MHAIWTNQEKKIVFVWGQTIPVLKNRQSCFCSCSCFLLWLWCFNWLMAVAKTRNTSLDIVKDFLSRKKNFQVVHPKRIDREFWNNVFWISNKTLGITISGFVAVMSSLRKISRRSSDPSSSYPKNNVSFYPCEVSLAQNWIAELKNLKYCAFRGSLQNKCFEIFGPSRSGFVEFKRPFSRIKTLEVPD